jgi:hypothetical protein
MKILEQAMMWKKMAAAAAEGTNASSSGAATGSAAMADEELDIDADAGDAAGDTQEDGSALGKRKNESGGDDLEVE